MSSNSERAAEYRRMVEDVVAGGTLDEDQWMQLKDLLARVERRVRASMPAKEPTA